MVNDLFGDSGGALSGLMGGLAKLGLVPKDTPEGQLMAAQADLSELRRQENELLLDIGRQAYTQNPSAWPQDSKLQLIQQNIAAAEDTLNAAKQTQVQADTAKAAEDAKGRCPSCGFKNPEGVKFCQECGTSLAQAAPKHCTSCGVELAVGTRFCGGCGAKQGEV